MRRPIANAVQVAALIWAVALVAFVAAVSGVGTGAGMAGSLPDGNDQDGFAVGVVLVLVLVGVTGATWSSDRTAVRSLVSIAGLAILHAALFGIYF